MSLQDLTCLSGVELNRLLANREIRAVDILDAFVNRITVNDPIIKAYISVASHEAYIQAQTLDDRISRGEKLPPLAGLPIAVKDNISTKGLHTTCAARILGDYLPPFDATAVVRLKAQGAIIIGKTNLDQFGMGSSTENSYFGPTRNPWNPSKVPGGTSGGSAAAVAARMCVSALGSDTGGSSRQPASFCNVLGLKPTYGSISRFGLLAYASSLDQVSIIARRSHDCAMIFEAIRGYDPLDMTSRQLPPFSTEAALRFALPTSLTVGVPVELFAHKMHRDVQCVFDNSLALLRSLGSSIVEVSLPSLRYAVASYYIIAMAEASANLSRYDGMRFGYSAEDTRDFRTLLSRTRADGFRAETKRRILLGTFALRSGYYERYYSKAQQVRSLIRKDFSDALTVCDVIATPVFPLPPFPIGELINDPLALYIADALTVPASLAGLPAMSIPAGFSAGHMPIGVQLQANYFREDLLLGISSLLEGEVNWPNQDPPDPLQEASFV